MEPPSILGGWEKGEQWLEKVAVGGMLQFISPPFCLQEGLGEIVSQREKLLSSQLAAAERLKGSCECTKLPEGWKGMELCLDP